jgi:hypothetical protein
VCGVTALRLDAVIVSAVVSVHNLGAEDLLALATLRAAAAAVHKHAHAGPVTQLELADAAANLCYNADNLVPAAAAAEEPASATFNFADAAATLKPHSSACPIPASLAAAAAADRVALSQLESMETSSRARSICNVLGLG